MKLGRKILLMLSAIFDTTVVAVDIYLTTTYNYARSEVDAILIPGGFGARGGEGKIEAVRYAREHKIPFFGICLGLQMAVIDFARNVAGLSEATSGEFQPGYHQRTHLLSGGAGGCGGCFTGQDDK